MDSLKFRISKHFTGILILTRFLLFARADELCEMKIDMCPERYNNDTIIVPEKVVSLSQTFRVCKPSNVVEDVNGVGNSPSIMLVIDHSGSMSGITGVTAHPTDTSGSRFTVTKAIIDTIYKKYAKAEIGIVLFQNVLYLDTKNHKYAVGLPDDYPYPGTITSQGYLPLIQLDTLLAEGERGISVWPFDLSINYQIRKGFSEEVSDTLVQISFFVLRSDKSPMTDGVSYGKVQIYDAVGNIVKKLNILKANPLDTIHFGTLWDGTNRSNRKVGSGVYLANIQITTASGEVKRFTRKIGIK